jgi:hypothetical protein
MPPKAASASPGRGLRRGQREGHKIIEHPAVGPITADYDVLTKVDLDPGLAEEGRKRKGFTPLLFQYIAHRGACGKTRVVP